MHHLARKAGPSQTPEATCQNRVMNSERMIQKEPLLRALSGHETLDVTIVASTGSTNADLMRLGDGDARTHILIAEQQTAGRGRLARPWLATPGGSLLVSVSLRLQRRVDALAGLSLAVGVSLAETLIDFGAPVRLKWPNDLQIDGRKLGGILIELMPSVDGHCRVIIGFGINVRLDSSVRTSVGQPATDLREHGLTMDRTAIAASLLPRLLTDVRRFERDGFPAFQDRFSTLDALIGRNVRVGDESAGRMAGVDASGRLLLAHAGDVRAFDAGETSVRADE